MKNRFKKGLALITGMMLTVSAVVGVLPQTVMHVNAADGKTITGLGTGAIADPTPGAGRWSLVYYGTYGNNSVMYRVLDVQTTDFGGSTMLLDCDWFVERMIMGDNYQSNSSYLYSWGQCTINEWLNGNAFYGNTNVFTAAEKAAIAASTKSGASNDDGQGVGHFDFQPLNGEHIFLLDIREVTNTSYGYPSSLGANGLRATGQSRWLRTLCDTLPSIVNDDGSVIGGIGNLREDGVCPAFNINLSSVIFSSVVSGTPGNPNARYKLTIKDENMSVAVTNGSSISRDGNAITVPYTISGTNAGNATQVSVVITDSPWTLGSAVTSGYAYLKLDVDSFGTTGTGTFTLPASYANKTCGTEYYVYIVAEDVNAGYATDYASAPVSVTIPGAPSDNGSDPTAPGTLGNSDSSGTPDTPGNSGSSGTPNTPGNSGSSGTPNPPAVDNESEPEPPANCMQEVEDKITSSIALGGRQTVRIEGYPALSYHVLEMLKDHSEITLVSEFSYDGLDYKITIPGSAVKLDPSVKWYGPKYLFPMFYMYGTDTAPAVQAYLDKYKNDAS